MEPLKINFVGNLPAVSSQTTVIVSSESDYQQVSDMLREDFAAKVTSIWVRENHLYTWLQAQVAFCGLSQHRNIEFVRTTPRSLLSAKWSIAIPDWITDDLTISAKLLDANLPSGCTSPETGLLSPVLGSLPEVFSSKLAGKLAESASDSKIEKALETPILTTAWRKLLERWSHSDSPSWATAYCNRVGSNPRRLWSDLTVWRLLRSYPVEALDYALDPASAAFVREVPLDSVREMSLSQEGRRLALDQIIQVFAPSNTGPVGRSKFDALLYYVSGELVEEFSAVESLLKRASFEISSTDIIELQKRFRTCTGLSPTRLSKLRHYVPPPRPARVEERNPDATSWISWSRDQYFPFRSWQMDRGVVDGAVESSVAAFSDWYCLNFNTVHCDPSVSAIQTISQWRDSILKDSVSLILLVDNLPWFFWDMFELALAKAGMHRHESAARFVPLPSHTSVCKPALIAGRIDATGADYLKMLKTRSKDEWHDRPVHYAFRVDQLSSLASNSEKSVILLNYLAGDETLHGDAQAAGSSWSEQLALLYGNLANVVGDFARQASDAGNGFGLYVLTDHGSTLILAEEKQAPDAQLSKKLFSNEKDRSATLTVAEAEQVPENLWKLGNRFVNPLTGTIHFIPRGHNTVASSGSRPLFCHGGATPEEVIVPSGTFRLHSATWSVPKLRLPDLALREGVASFYVKRIVSLGIEIQNGNNERCHLESVAIFPDIAEIRAFDTISIPANAIARTNVSLYFGTSATAETNISLRFTFRIGTDTLEQHLDLPVTVTSAASGGLDLRTLLS